MPYQAFFQRVWQNILLKYFLYDHSEEYEKDEIAGKTSTLDRADDGVSQ